MDYIAFGQRVRYFRARKHLTQEQLAEKAEISASFLGHIERGTRVASLDTLMQLCTALEVMPNDLLEDDLAGLRGGLPKYVTIMPDELLQNIAMLLRKRGNP